MADINSLPLIDFMVVYSHIYLTKRECQAFNRIIDISKPNGEPRLIDFIKEDTIIFTKHFLENPKAFSFNDIKKELDYVFDLLPTRTVICLMYRACLWRFTKNEDDDAFVFEQGALTNTNWRTAELPNIE